MAEPFYRFGEWVVPPVVALNGTKFTFRGLENIPARGGALLALFDLVAAVVVDGRDVDL